MFAGRKLLPRPDRPRPVDDRVTSMLPPIQVLFQCDAGTHRPWVLLALDTSIERDLTRRSVFHCHPMLDLTSRDNTDRKVGALAIEQRSVKRAVEDMKVLQGHDQPDAWAVSRN